MINLDTKIKPEQASVVDYSVPVPEGEYICKVLEVKPWTSKKVAKIVNSKTKEVMEDVTIYNSTVHLEILDGDNKGRRLFYNLTTHPNMPWIIPNFLFATGAGECSLNELPTVCVGKTVLTYVKIEEREVTKEDKDTGIPTTKSEKFNSVRSVKPCPVTVGLDITDVVDFDI